MLGMRRSQQGLERSMRSMRWKRATDINLHETSMIVTGYHSHCYHEEHTVTDTVTATIHLNFVSEHPTRSRSRSSLLVAVAVAPYS
jgi:hypothetical protein